MLGPDHQDEFLLMMCGPQYASAAQYMQQLPASMNEAALLGHLQAALIAKFTQNIHLQTLPLQPNPDQPAWREAMAYAVPMLVQFLRRCHAFRGKTGALHRTKVFENKLACPGCVYKRHIENLIQCFKPYQPRLHENNSALVHTHVT